MTACATDIVGDRDEGVDDSATAGAALAQSQGRPGTALTALRWG